MRKPTTILVSLIVLSVIYAFIPAFDKNCNCDHAATEKIIKSTYFNKLPQIDDTLTDKEFYSLPAADNMILWYRDIENPDTTKFTGLWNDYSRNNYHTSHLNFIKYYQGKKDIELAFQFGPNEDLWAYHIFVIKKIGCCFLATRSYFRHARFTGKSYAILNNTQVDRLFIVLSEQKPHAIDTVETFDYSGYFMDNRNNKSFCINFEKDQLWVPTKQDTAVKRMEIRPEIKKLYDFVDDSIKWIKTYKL